MEERVLKELEPSHRVSVSQDSQDQIVAFQWHCVTGEGFCSMKSVKVNVHMVSMEITPPNSANLVSFNVE